MKNNYYLIFCTLISVTLLRPSEAVEYLTNTTPEIKTNIFSFLDWESSVQTASTGKDLKNVFDSNTPSGQYLRKEAKFHVELQNGKYLYNEEFLAHANEVHEVKKINNIISLSKENPEQLISIMIKSIPNNLYSINSDLINFYENVFQVDGLVNSLDVYNRSDKKLASFLLEMLIFEQFISAVEDQVWEKLGPQFQEQLLLSADVQLVDQAMFNIGSQLFGRVRDQMGFQYLHQIVEQVWPLLSEEKWDLFTDKVVFQHLDQLESYISDKVSEDLSRFLFASEDLERGALQLTVSHLFTAYQLSSIIERNSSEYKNLHQEITTSISDLIPENEINHALNNLRVPENTNNPFIDTQLKLLRRPLFR